MNDRCPIPEDVDRNTLCEFLQISSSRLKQLTELGMPKTSYGKYPFKPCIQWAISHYRQNAPKKRESGSTEQARKALYEAQTYKFELENKRTTGELIEIEDAKQLLMMLANLINSRLEALPSRLTHDPKQRDRLLSECRAIRVELSRAVQDCDVMRHLQQDTEAATDPQRGRVGRADAADDAAGDTDTRAVA